jgi:hypothetical protein
MGTWIMVEMKQKGALLTHLVKDILTTGHIFLMIYWNQAEDSKNLGKEYKYCFASLCLNYHIEICKCAAFTA